MINWIVAYTDEHYADNLTLNFISQTFALHPAYFCKLFKRTMGTTYIDYLTNCRIRRAKELLRQTDLPNNLIAEQTGFQTTEYFSKIFKKKPVFLPRNTGSAEKRGKGRSKKWILSIPTQQLRTAMKKCLITVSEKAV